MTLPPIAVVIPSYQQAAYLRAALDSILNQNYPALELIVMDGGSTDGSRAILEAYAPRLTAGVSEADRGQSHAINKGFARSTAPIMTWLNSDDELLPNALHTIGEIFSRFPQVNWLTGQPANMDADGQMRVSRFKAGRRRSWIERGWYHGRLWGFIRQEGTFWRRSLWEQAGAAVDEDKHYTMDYDLWQRFAAYTDLYTVDQPLAAFRHHAAQKTAALDQYYAEAGIHTPKAARLVMLPVRAITAPLMWRLSPRILRKNGAWRVYS
jgi:glycosyltransferase involved in cell wall biosynthesis